MFGLPYCNEASENECVRLQRKRVFFPEDTPSLIPCAPARTYRAAANRYMDACRALAKAG